MSAAVDEKKVPEAEPYVADPERQSDKVGSLNGKGASDKQGGSLFSSVSGILGRYWKKVAQLVTFMVFTAWWIYGLVKYRHTAGKGWLIPTLVYIGVLVRLITLYIPATLFLRPVRWVWIRTAVKVHDMIPAPFRKPAAALVTVAAFLIGTFVPEETGDNTRANRAVSVFGLIVMMVILTATSRNWRLIPWHTVIGGMLTQFIVAVFVLRTKAGYDMFKFISDMARQLLGFSGEGLAFLTSDSVPAVGWFLTAVIPAIIFFIALVQMLYYVGFLQWFIRKLATFFFWSLRVSGAEAVVAAATPFIGQGESAMLIRPFMNDLTMSEIHQIMTCGFATIAGSVLVAYIGMGLNAQALVSSCIMSIPATLAVSKMRYPEMEEPLTAGKVEVPKNEEDEHTVNALHAFTNGSWFGLKIGATIVACLLTVIAFVGLVNGLLGWWGGYWGLSGENTLSLELLLGYILYPFTWLLGVPKQDVRAVGVLIGRKIIINEYAAFSWLVNEEPYKSMLPRSKLIATYACCGFGNIGSLGIQIGVLSQIAPRRSGDVVKVAVSALFCGILSTLTSASIAGMLFTDDMLQ
ncbi:putative nucleoside:sodium symporter protein [Thermochaetoides thermophila DSM 1495]|uniref:Putative nucleoside:sodium symporter protein n=1 Tax=Chaetomium thermophilum (strain DSM 1495 / CBS 144.50 / IMI 039719) TaxID=759272 RepID=G0S3G8_CHATD|nr:putative nucleoside:sodium symporter protein [Thermochaetoides thermophila DSM 1495]EGS22551.1 putative nucleoside:sodium symporter protein [Thermochaetoides thermophila DSM 1495]